MLKLESGNDTLQQLIRDDSKAIAGAWEGYQLAVTERIAEANPHIDYSDTIKQQYSNLAIALTYGRNAIGVDASSISSETMTNIEMCVDAMMGNVNRTYANDISFAP